MLDPFIQKYGNWALITGASSGIGKCFASALASKGFNLVLVSRDLEKLSLVAKDLEKEYACSCRLVSADLSTEASVAELVDATQDLQIGILVNNAGYALTGDFIDSELKEQSDLLKIHTLIPMQLCHHFAQRMKVLRRGAVVNVASIAGMMPMPTWSIYAAAKAFLLSFSEALWYELKPYGIDVLAVCPGATRTNFHSAARIKASGAKPEDVVAKALKDLGKSPVSLYGVGNKVITLILKLCPVKLRIKLAAIAVSKMS